MAQVKTNSNEKEDQGTKVGESSLGLENEVEGSPDPSLRESANPHTIGEQTASGSQPHPSSDDDVLKNAQTMDIAVEADSENPKELNIAEDVRKAEEQIKNS